jgi:hypothetical protein
MKRIMSVKRRKKVVQRRLLTGAYNRIFNVRIVNTSVLSQTRHLSRVRVYPALVSVVRSYASCAVRPY